MADRSREPDMRLEMLSQPRLLAPARAMVSNFAQRMGFDEAHCGQISLAVDEALCNVINHGYQKRADGRIWINLWGGDEEAPSLTIIIEDLARQIDPETIRSRDLDDIRPGGLGVYIIREIMDEVRYEKREGGGMQLTMHKRMPVDGPAKSHAAAPKSTSRHVPSKEQQ
jgi:anti-sigma regulatory factor (Ser/Thr protein kinase)